MGEQLSTKEATLPEIAITPGDDAEGNDHALDLTEALTDIEDLHEDQSEEKPYKNYRKSKLKILLKDADAGLTDMEDVEASDGDDNPDEIVKHKTPISLDSLDFDYNNFEEVQKPKHKKGKLERSISLSNNAAGNTLGLDKFNDDQDVTECENFPTSNEVSEDECDDLEDNPILKMYTDYENIVHSNEMKTNSVEMAASPKIANVSNLLVPIQPKVPELTDVESLDSDDNARGDRKTRKKHRHSKCIISNNKQKYSSEYICKKRNGKNRTMKDKVVSVPTYVIKSTSDCEMVEFPACKQIAKKRSITSSKSFTSQTELEDVETDEDIFSQKIIRRSISEDTLLKQMENFCLNAEEMSNQRTERANKNKLNKTSKPKKCKGGQCCPRNKAEGLQNKKSLAVVDTVEPLTDVEQISSSSEHESSSCTSNETSSDELSAEEGVIVLDDDTGCEIILPPAVRTLVITENDDYMKPVIKIVPLDDSEEFQKPKERIMDCLTEEEELQGDNIVESDHEAEEEEINLDYGVISVSEASSPAETKKSHKRPPTFREMHLKYLTATNVKSHRVTDIEDLSMSDDARSDHIKQNYAHDSNGKGYNKLVSALQVTSNPSPVVTDTENLEDSTDDELGQEISQSKKVRKKCSKGTESVLYLRGGGCNLFDLECGRLLNKISILKFMPLVYKQIRSTDFEWDATAQSKLEPTEVKREEVVAQKDVKSESPKVLTYESVLLTSPVDSIELKATEEFLQENSSYSKIDALIDKMMSNIDECEQDIKEFAEETKSAVCSLDLQPSRDAMIEVPIKRYVKKKDYTQSYPLCANSKDVILKINFADEQSIERCHVSTTHMFIEPQEEEDTEDVWWEGTFRKKSLASIDSDTSLLDNSEEIQKTPIIIRKKEEEDIYSESTYTTSSDESHLNGIGKPIKAEIKLLVKTGDRGSETVEVKSIKDFKSKPIFATNGENKASVTFSGRFKSLANKLVPKWDHPQRGSAMVECVSQRKRKIPRRLSYTLPRIFVPTPETSFIPRAKSLTDISAQSTGLIARVNDDFPLKYNHQKNTSEPLVVEPNIGKTVLIPKVPFKPTERKMDYVHFCQETSFLPNAYCDWLMSDEDNNNGNLSSDLQQLSIDEEKYIHDNVSKIFPDKITKLKLILDQTNAFIKSESLPEPFDSTTNNIYVIRRHEERHDERTPEPKKKKKGILGTLKIFMSKSIDSETESEGSPKKLKKEKKTKSKDGATLETKPPKPRLPTPPETRKEYDNIPYIESSPSEAVKISSEPIEESFHYKKEKCDINTKIQVNGKMKPPKLKIEAKADEIQEFSQLKMTTDELIKSEIQHSSTLKIVKDIKNREEKLQTPSGIEAIVTEVPINMTETAKKPVIEIIQKSDTQLTEAAPKHIQSEIKELLKEKQSEKDIFKVDRKTILDTMVFLENEIENYGPSADTISLPEKLPRPERSPDAATVQKEETSQPKSRKTSSSSTQRAQQDIENSQSFLTMEVQNYYDHRTTPEKHAKKGNIIKKVGKKFGKLFGSKDSIEKPKSIDGDEKEALEEAFRQQEDVKNRTESPYSSRLSKASLSPKASLAVEEDVLKEEDVEKVISLTQKSFEKSPSQEMKSTTEFLDKEKKLYEDSQYKISQSENDETLVVTTDKGKTSIEMVDSKMATEQLIANTNSFLNTEIEHYYDYKADTLSKEKKDNVIKKVGKSLTKEIGKIFGSKESLDKEKKSEGVTSPEKKVKGSPKLKKTKQRSKEEKLLSPEKKSDQKKEICSPEKLQKVIKEGLTSAAPIDETDRFIKTEKELYYSAPFSKPREVKESLSVKQPLVAKEPKKETDITKKQTETSEALPKAVDFAVDIAQQMRDTKDFLALEIQHYYDYRASPDKKSKKDNVIKKVGKSISKEIGKMFKGKEKAVEEVPAKDDVTKEHVIEETSNFLNQEQASYVEEKPLAAEQEVMERKDLEPVESKPDKGKLNDGEILLKTDTDNFISQERVQYDDGKYEIPRPIQDTTVPKIGEPIIEGGVEKIIIPVDVIEDLQQKTEYELKPELRPSPEFLENLQMTDDFLRREILHYYDHRIGTPEKHAKKENVIKKMGKTISKEFGKLFTGKEDKIKDKKLKRDSKEDSSLEDKVDLETCNAFLENEKKLYIPDEPKNALEVSKITSPKMEEIVIATKTETMHSMPKTQLLVETVKDAESQMHDSTSDVLTEQVSHHLAPEPPTHVVLPQKVLEDIENTKNFLHDEIRHYYDFRTLVSEKQAKKPNIIKKVGKTISKEFGKLFVSKEESEKPKVVQKKESISSLNNFYTEEDSPAVLEAETAKVFDMPSIPKEADEDAFRAQEAKEKELAQKKLEEETKASESKETESKEVLEQIKATDTFLSYELLFYDSDEKKSDLPVPPKSTVYSELIRAASADKDAQQIVKKDVVDDTSVIQVHTKIEETIQGIDEGTKRTDVFSKIEITKRSTTSPAKIVQETVQERRDISDLIYLPGKKGIPSHVAENMRACEEFLNDEIVNYHDVKTIPFENVEVSKTHETRAAKDKEPQADKELQNEGKDKKKGTTIMKKVEKGLGKLFDVKDKKVIEDPAAEPVTEIVHTLESKPLESVKTGQLVEKSSEEIDKKVSKSDSIFKKVGKIFESKDKHESTFLSPVRNPELEKNVKQCEQFLNGEVTNYHDVRPILPTSVEEIIQRQSDISKVESEVPAEKLKKEGKSDTIFQKFGKVFETKEKKEKKIAQPTEHMILCDNFLKTEVENYHDAKPVITVEAKEASSIPEKLTESEVEKINYKKDKKDSTALAKIGKMFGSKDKKDRGESPQRQHTLEGVKEDIRKSQEFLDKEIEHYDDATPAQGARTEKAGIVKRFTKMFGSRERSESPKRSEKEYDQEISKSTEDFLNLEIENYYDAKEFVTEKQKHQVQKTEDLVTQVKVVKEEGVLKKLIKIKSKEQEQSLESKEETPKHELKIRSEVVVTEVNKYENDKPLLVEKTKTEQIDDDKKHETIEERPSEKPKQKEDESVLKKLGKMLSRDKKDVETPKLKRKQEEMKANQQVAKSTQEFLNGEIHNYYDVKPTVFKKILVKEIHDVSTSKPDKKPEETKLITTDVKATQDKERRHPSTEEFLNIEIEKYHDARPASTQITLSEIEQLNKDYPEAIDDKKEEKGMLQKLGKILDNDKQGLKDLQMKEKQELYEKESKEQMEQLRSIDDFLKKEVEHYYDAKPAIYEFVGKKVSESITEQVIPTDFPVLQTERQMERFEKLTEAPVDTSHVKPIEADVIQPKVSEIKHAKKPEERSVLKKLGKMLSKEKKEVESPKKQQKQVLDDAHQKQYQAAIEAADDFLKCEIDNYHDVKPTAFELISDVKAEKIPLKQAYIQPIASESAAAKDDKKEEKGVLRKLGKMLSKDKKDESPKQKKKHIDDDHQKQTSDVAAATNAFLTCEIANYNDVKLVTTEGASAIKALITETELSPIGAKLEPIKDDKREGIFEKLGKLLGGKEKKEEETIRAQNELEYQVIETTTHEDFETTRNFLVNEIDNYQDAPRTSVGHSPQKVETNENIDKKKDKDDGVLKKLGQMLTKEKKEETPKKKVQDDKDESNIKQPSKESIHLTNDFLTEEIKSYHDVKPKCFEPILADEQPIEIKEADELAQISPQSKKKAKELKDKVETKAKTEGILQKLGGIITGKARSESPKRKVFSEEAVILMRDSKNFLSQEIHNYDDVMPTKKQKPVEEFTLGETIEESLLTAVEQASKQSEKSVKKQIDQVESEIRQEGAAIEGHVDTKIDKVAESAVAHADFIEDETKGGIIKKLGKMLGSQEKKESITLKSTPISEEEHQLIRNTNDFLNLEVESYEDVKPVKFDMVVDPTRTEHVDQKQKIKDDSLLNKIGMIFTGKDKRESVSPKRELVSDVVKLDMKTTDDFLKTEVYNYEDVKAQAKSAEAIYPEEEKEIKKLAKVVEEKEKPKEDGILKKLGKVLGGDRKEKSPKRKVVSDEVKQLLEDTNTFLNAEIEHYEDVKPTKYEPIIIESQEVKDKEESVLKRLSKVFTSTDKKPESPKSIRYKDSTNEAIRKSDEFLNIEKSAYYDTKPMSLETSKNVTDEAKQKTHKHHDKEGKEEGVLKRLSKVFTSTDQKGDTPKDLDQDVSKAEALKSSQEFLNTEKEKYEDALARSSPAKEHDKHEKDDGILKKTFGKLFSAKEKRETESPKYQEISDATKEEMKLSEEFLMVEIENYEDAKHISEIKLETRLKDEAVAPESLKTKFTKMFTSNDEKNAEDVQMDRQLREDIRKSQEFLNTELINYEDAKHKADVKSSQKSEKEGTLKKKFTKMFSKEKKDRESPQREAKEIDETVTKDIKETKEFLSCEVTNYHDTRPFTQKVVEIEKDQARPVVDAEKESADGILNKLGKMLGGKEQKRKDSPVKKPDGTEEDETRKITESFLNSEIKNYEDVRLLPVHTKEPDVQTKTIVAEVQSSSKPTETKDTQTIQEEQETGIIFRIKGKDVETPKTTKKQISATDELKSSKEFLTEVVKNYQDVKVKDDKEPDKAKKQETKDDTVLKKLGRLFESKDKREESPKRELAQDIKQTIDACHMFLEQEITHYENGKQIHFKETTMPTIKNKIEDDKKDEGKKDKTIFQKVGKIFESPKVKVKRDTKQLPTLSNEVKEAMSITGDFLTNEISNYQDVKILSKEPTEKVASSNDVKEAAKKVKDKPPKDKTVFKKVGKLFDSPKKKDKKTAEGSKTQSDSEDQVGSKDGTILKKVGKSIGKLFEDKDKKVESTKQAEVPKKDGGVEEAKAMCNEFLTTEIVNYHDVKPIVQRPKKKEKHSVVGSNNDPGVVITKEVKTTTEEKVFEDKIEEDGKVTDIKIDITRTVIDTVRTSEEVVTEEIINLRDEEIRISPIPRIKETGVEETHDFLDKEKSMYWDKEDKHRENKPVASPTLGHKKPKSDSSELTRTVSDNAGMLDKLHEGEAPEKHTISETNIDLSNLPRNAEEYIPSRQEVFTGKTSLAPSVASHRAHSLEEPVIVDLNVEQMGTITEPAEATFAIPVVDVADKSIKKPLFHLESSEDDDLLEGRRPTLPSVQSIVEHTEPKVEQARREFKKDVDIIEKKLSDLDKALGGLEKSIEFDVVEKSSEKVESKLRRIERKFERMASQALEDSAELQPHLTVSEVEKIQEREYQKLVSQLSLEEVNEFQKDYSTFWDEQTFSKSDDLGLKTPDTPADAQELPQDKIIYMGPVVLNQGNLINKAGVEVNVIPIAKSPQPRRKKLNRNRSKHKKEQKSNGIASNQTQSVIRQPLLLTVMKMDPKRFLVEPHKLEIKSDNIVKKGAITNAVENWLNQQSDEFNKQKEISCEPLTQASSQTVVPQPHPRVQKVADKVEKDRPKQVSPVRDDLLDKDEQESDTYSDKKKFWETITKQSDQKRMSLHEIKALENELNKKRASIHEISEPPQPKPRSDLTTSSESEDEKPPKLIETSGRMTSGLPFDEEDEVPRTEYQASFLPPQEQKPKQTIASDSRTTSKELEKEDSLDSDMDAVGYNSQTGYISDSGDVEHYISDSEIEDRVPQIRERQMSVFSPPVSTGKKSIYERSASLPTEDLYEVSARSIKLRKQYYEEQIKKEMIEEQLTSELEEETSPEKKSLPAFEEDEFESVPSLPEDKEPKKSVKDLAKKFDSLEDDASKAQSALKEASKTPTKEKEHLDKSEIEHSEKQGEHSSSKVGEEYIPEITVTLSGKQRRWSEESDETAKDEKPEISEISKEDHVKTQDKDVGIINKRTKFDEKSTVKEQEKFKKTKSKEEKTKDEKPQGKEQQLKDVKSAIKDERALSEDDKSIDKKIKDKKLKDEKYKDLKSKDQKLKEEKSKSHMVKDDKLKDEKTKAGKLKDQKTKDEELKDQKSKDRERDEPKDEKPKSKDVKLKSKELRSQVVEVKTKAKEEKSVTKDQKSHIKDAKVLTKGEDDKAKPQDQKVVAKDEKLENKMKDHVVDLNKFKKEHEKQVHETPKTNQDEEGVIKVSNIIDKKPIDSQKELKAAESTKLMTNKLEEHENLKKVILAQPLCQPEEHDIQETVWEVSVQSEQRFDEKLMDIPTKEYVGLGVPQDPSTDKDDDLSSNARDESDLTSEIHQDHSDSLSDKIISDSHSDIEKIIMDSLHQQKVEPVEAKAIASALLEEIEEEIGKMDPLMSAVDETRTTFSESNKRQISEYLRKMAESKGLEDREIELVESVLARRQRELIKLARGDTQASSVEITDEDLRYSGGEADFPQLLEQQMDQLEAEKVDDIKAVYASIEEEQKQKDKSSTFDKIDEEQFTEKSSTQEYESYEKNGKTTHKKDTSITGYDRIKGEVFGSEKRNVILEEDESVLEVTSEEAAKVKGTSITDIQEDICSAGDKKLSQESHRSATKEHIEGESHRQSQIKDTYQNDREKQVSKIATTTEVRGGKQITTQDIKMDIEDTGLGIQQIATATLGKTQELCYEKQDEKSSATSEKMTLPDGRTLETMSEITEVSKTSKEETKDHVQELSQIVTLKEGDKTLPMKTKVDAMGRTSSSDSKSSVESSGRSAEDPFSSCSSGRKDEIGDGKIQTKVKLRKTKSEMDTSSSSSNLKPNRLSAIETEGHSSSGESYYHSFDSGRSRPCSSDVEGFFAGGSSEYESALTSQDTSIKSHITSGEYHTAISSLSSKESMKSLDSESSGNLASVEISEVSETIVPSSSDLEGDILDVQEHLLEELEQQPIVTEPPEFESKDSLEEIEEGQIFDVHSKMKRSCEMTFQPEPKVLLAESPQGESEEKFGTSLDEGSVLSISLSSTSSVQLPTVIELSRSDTPPGVSQKMYSSYEEVPSLSTSQADISTSTLLQHTDSPVDSVTIMTSKVEENGIYSVSTQVSSETRTDEPKKKGHRRQESSTIHFTKIETHKPQSDLTESDEYSGLGLKDDRKEDEQYQTEADQGFQKDMREGRYTVTHETHQRKKSHSEVSDSSEKSDKSSFEEAEAEAAFNMVAHVSPVHKVKQIIPILEDEAAEKDELETVERIKREKEKELELLRQKIRDQSPGSIPDIKVTEHMTPESASKTSSLDMDDQEKDAQKSTPETPASNSSKSSEETDQGREYILDDTTPSIREEAEETSESRIMTESRSEMGSTIIEKTTREETDSPNSDSFEMLEKPDLIDDFVVIEEVAKEAHECDAEGKSVKIQQKTTKRTIRKRTEDDEEPCVRSAPTPLTRMTDIKFYPDGSDELGFDFEESPPQPEENGRNRDYVREYNNELEANRQWIEQQFQGSQAATMAAGFGYEMEFERGPLEDIKEEDITDFDPSSRIGSLGSQKESGGSLGSVKDSYSSTPEYDVLAGKKYFTRSGENDDVSMSSLQEFESLERAMSLETKKFHQGSHSSSSNGSLKTKYGKSQGDDISVSSLKEFEGLEIACIAAHKIELKVKEEEALLSQIDEGQESIASESESCETVSVPEKRPPESDEEDYEKRMFEIDEIIKQAQTNVERFVDIKECEKTESLGRGDSVEEVSKVPDLDLDAPVVRSTIKVQFKESDDPMILSTDSLDCKVEESSRRGSTDSLDEKVPPADLMTTSTDSIEACSKRASEQITSDSLGRMVFSDSLELAAAANAAAAVLSDSIDEDGSRIGQDFSSSSTGRDFSSSVREDDPEQAGIPMEYMLGSTDSLEPTSSTATHATYQFESDSVFSGSFTSGGSNTMVSSTDTIDPMHVRETVDIAAAVKKVWFDENTDKEFTTEYLDYGSRPYVTEVIEPCDDGEYSHTIRRRVEMPPEIRKVTFQGPDAEEQLRRYMEEFGEGEFCQETEEVDADGNVHVKRVVQKRVIIKGGGAKPESLDEFQTEPGISKGSKDQPQLTKLTSDTGAVPKESSGFHHGRPEDQPGADSLHESTSEVDQKSPKPEPEKRDQ